MLRRHVSPHDKGAKHSEARTTTHHILLSEDIKKIDEQESSDLSPFRIVLSDRKALAIHREHNVSCAARSSVKGLPAPPRNSECRARSARAKQLCSEAAQGGRSWRCPGGAGDPQRRRRRVVDNIKGAKHHGVVLSIEFGAAKLHKVGGFIHTLKTVQRSCTGSSTQLLSLQLRHG